MKIKRVEHIAIAVQSLTQSIELMRDTFGIPLEYEEQIGQTRLAMLPVGQTYIELLEGQGPESGVTKWMNDKGAGLFHICFEVEDIDGQGRQAARRDSAHRARRLPHCLPRSGEHGQRAHRACGATRRPLKGCVPFIRMSNGFPVVRGQARGVPSQEAGRVPGV
jgi:methylmalonyl-CoA epimerase